MNLLGAKSLAFAYRDTPVLREVSLTLAAGEVVALLGPNGSGKSTLIKCLLGHLHAHGEILWEDKPLRKWSRRELARHVAYLAQSPAFEPQQTVSEVLQLGRAPYWRAFGVESTRDVEVVTSVANQLGLNDFLTRRMDEISGGQRQRVFLGRALAQEPRAMLLDEPGTYLDLKHQVELLQLLRTLAKDSNVGVLMASHDLNLAALAADRLIVLSNGAIAADGPPSDVLRPELLANVWGIAMQRIDREGKTPIVFPDV
jgi:iron complex transport system ATP-binding protein